MDIGKALSFMFEDEEWVTKLLLGSLITLIPIFGQFALMGYGIAIVRNVRAGSPRPLPAWDNLGGYFMDGIKFWVVTIIYAIPILIVICPFAVVGSLPALGGESEELITALAGLSTVLIIGLSCLVTLYGILLALLTPVLQIHYAERSEIGACLRFGDVFRYLFGHIGSILLSQLVLLGVAILVGPLVVGLTCGLLGLPFSVWLTALSSHMYGQIASAAATSTPYAF
jgi:hypothetical protein